VSLGPKLGGVEADKKVVKRGKEKVGRKKNPTPDHFSRIGGKEGWEALRGEGRKERTLKTNTGKSPKKKRGGKRGGV